MCSSDLTINIFLSSCRLSPTQVIRFRLLSDMAVRFFVALFLFGLVPAQSQESNLPSVRLGIDVLSEGGFRQLKGKKVGLVTNPSGVDGKGVPTWQRLQEALGSQLVALYGPEHGVFGKVGAGKGVFGEKHGVDRNRDGKISKDEESGIQIGRAHV